MQQAQVGAAGPSAMMMPFFMGCPWVQKFSGENAQSKFGEWKHQAESMLSFQPLTDSQKADILLNLLEGEAKREILTLERSLRDTPKKILDVLHVLYGDNTHVSVLRTRFFNCRQQPPESLKSFSLRLRELFLMLKQRNEAGLEDGDALLRDQFVMGLREGSLRQELRRLVRKTPTLSFDEVKMEALSLEEEQAEQWSPSSCMAIGKQVPHAQTTTDWKTELKNELLKEVKDQVAEMSKNILSELQENRTVPNTRMKPESNWRTDNRARPASRGIRGTPRYEWDQQGRPICATCKEAGHFSRSCHSRAPHQDF